MNRKNQERAGSLVCIGAALLLLIALAPLPYSYYSLLRVLITVAAGIMATFAATRSATLRFWAMVSIALLFNPVTPIPLTRPIWAVLDVIVAVAFLLAARANRGTDAAPT